MSSKLGQTAVGSINMENTRAHHNTSLWQTYHMQLFGEATPTEEQSDDTNATLKRFWGLETMGITHLSSLMTPDKSAACW